MPKPSSLLMPSGSKNSPPVSLRSYTGFVSTKPFGFWKLSKGPSLTKAQKAERMRCRKSPAYFLERYCQVYDATARVWLAFGLWPAQRDVLIDLEQQRLTVILKARQLGLSWLVVGWALWLMLFQPAATVLFFSKRDQEAVHLLAFRLRGMLDRLPEWLPPGPIAKQARGLRPVLVADNDHNIELANGSVGMAFPTTGGRSYTASLVVVDEADFADNLDALLAAVKPTIDAGGRLILLSTADKSKPQSAFKRIYGAGKRGENGYRAIFLPWTARPGRSAAWYEEQKRDVLARTAATDDLFQEYPATDFEALAPRSLDRRFAAEWLRGCDDTVASTQSGVGPTVSGLVIWRLPQPGETFVIGADPAEGNPQSDNSAASVVDLAGVQVAAWAGRVEPATFGSQVAAVSAFFNDAAALVERNNHGHAVLLWLREFSTVQALPGLDKKPGWATTGASKPLAYDNAADAFRDGGSVIRDPDTLAELGNITTELRAPEGLKDDRATAHVLALAALRFCSVGPAAAAVPVAPVDVVQEADTGGW